MLNMMSRIGKSARSHRRGGVQKQQILRSVETISRHTAWTSCLPRAMTGQALLRRYGFETELRLGIKKDKSGTLRAHAWVAEGNAILIGDTADLATYRPFPALKGFGR